MQNKVDYLYERAHAMMKLAKLHLYTTISVVDTQQEVHMYHGGWSGDKPLLASKASIVGPGMEAELRNTLDPKEAIAMTPTENFALGFGYMGGVRVKLHGNNDLHAIVSCRGLSQRTDAMIALMLIHGLNNDIVLHHVGFIYPTLRDMNLAIEAAEDNNHVKAIKKVVDAKQRYYFKISGERKQRPCWIEHFYNEAQPTKAIYWDLVTPNPLKLLEFIANNTQSKINKYNPDQNDAIGAIWEEHKNDTTLGIIVRSNWWDIK